MYGTVYPLLHFWGKEGDMLFLSSWGDFALLIWQSTDTMSALYCAQWESIELLSLAAGKVNTRSACREGDLKRQAVPFWGEQLWEDRKQLIFIMDLKTLVLMANCKLPLTVENLFGLHWIAFPNRQFGWIRARWSAVWQRSSGFVHTTALVLPYPFCAEVGAVVPGPSPLWASLLVRASTDTHENSGPCNSTCLRTATHQDCTLREKADFVRVIVLWPNKTNAKLLFPVSLIQIQQLSEFRKFPLYLEACGLRFEVVLNSLFNYQFWFWKQRC